MLEPFSGGLPGEQVRREEATDDCMAPRGSSRRTGLLPTPLHQLSESFDLLSRRSLIGIRVDTCTTG